MKTASQGVRIEGTQGTYSQDAFPYIALRYTKIDGEDYGRSYVEESVGDLIALEGLSRAIGEAAQAAALVFFLVNPNGKASVDQLNKAANLSFVTCAHDAIKTLQLDKFADMRIALETAQAVEMRLQQAFLMTSSVRRQAERVTWGEIQTLVGELEDTLGGLYSVLAQEFQLPYLTIKVEQMKRAKKLPPIPEAFKKNFRPVIIAGLDALGRGHEFEKLQLYAGYLASYAQVPAQMLVYLDLGDIIQKGADALGVKLRVRSETEVQRQQQAAQMSQLAQGLGPEVIRQLGQQYQTQQQQQSA